MLYKVCRYFCAAVPTLSELFSADIACFAEFADAAMKREEIIMKRWSLRHTSHVPVLAGILADTPSEQHAHATLSLMHRGEHLMRDCIPFA